MAEQLDKIADSLQKDLTMAEHEDFAGHCEKCSEPVLNDTGPGVSYTLEGVRRAFHRHCFNCEDCQSPIRDGSFFMHNDKPHCRACYEKVLGNCGKCEKPLIGSQIMKAGDSKFHPSCFACCKCRTELTARYFEKRGELYCRDCYETEYVPVCSGCTGKILPDAESTKITMVEWKDNKYHPKCFACRDCHTPFNDLKALHHKGELYCEPHYFEVVKKLDDFHDAARKSIA
ncbi:Transforming growth factor beta-1-induced transcript 1 protein [Geranomyces variabilis]|nr:Transforming growth factor beta-1-induced transcript 1 protein [Geranomyces variabilis]